MLSQQIYKPHTQKNYAVIVLFLVWECACRFAKAQIVLCKIGGRVALDCIYYGVALLQFAILPITQAKKCLMGDGGSVPANKLQAQILLI